MSTTSLDRRSFLAACSRAGMTSALLPGVLYTLAAQAQQNQRPGKAPELAKITPEMIDQAAALAGVGPFTAEQKQMMLEGLSDQRGSYEPIRALNIPNSVPPAFVFNPRAVGERLPPHQLVMMGASPRPVEFPSGQIEDLAFESVANLGVLLKTRKITSLALTQMYLERIKRYDSKLHFAITLTEERALAQAKAADAEIAAGHYRGPLHGIPWGAKDLLAVKGYPTTWGSAHSPWATSGSAGGRVIHGTSIRAPAVLRLVRPVPSPPDALPSPSALRPWGPSPLPPRAAEPPACAPPSASSRAPAQWL